MKIQIPPIKCQGIKSKLVPWIKDCVTDSIMGKWIEPFVGSGVVGFNIAPEEAVFCDTNPHIIDFYSKINDGSITPWDTRIFLEIEGHNLIKYGEAYYYEVRERFNKYHEPLDFLFLNRSCFNGVIRFNRGGGFNTPFCRKPMRFSKSYITKIVNQVGFVYNLAQRSKWVFKCQDFRLTLSEVTEQDIVYCDPPYIGRHVDYYNGWSGSDETALFHQLKNCPANFILSTWHSNQHRDNPYITSLWSDFHQLTKEHFYHIGANKENRKPMLEALILNFVPEQIIQHETQARKILPLFQQNLVQ